VNIFSTSDSSHAHRNGQRCSIVRDLVIGVEVDEECAPMHRIAFEDGTEIDAYPDELAPVPSSGRSESR
jgi:hypothetical protein